MCARVIVCACVRLYVCTGVCVRVRVCMPARVCVRVCLWPLRGVAACAEQQRLARSAH